MGEFTLAELGNMILSGASALVLVSGAVEKIAKGIRAAKAPDTKQNERLDKLEAWQAEVDKKLHNDHERFESLDAGSRVTQRALLALLDHGIDGNNIEQMQHAKEELQNHLINR